MPPFPDREDDKSGNHFVFWWLQNSVLARGARHRIPSSLVRMQTEDHETIGFAMDSNEVVLHS